MGVGGAQGPLIAAAAAISACSACAAAQCAPTTVPVAPATGGGGRQQICTRRCQRMLGEADFSAKQWKKPDPTGNRRCCISCAAALDMERIAMEAVEGNAPPARAWQAGSRGNRAARGAAPSHTPSAHNRAPVVVAENIDEYRAAIATHVQPTDMVLEVGSHQGCSTVLMVFDNLIMTVAAPPAPDHTLFCAVVFVCLLLLLSCRSCDLIVLPQDNIGCKAIGVDKGQHVLYEAQRLHSQIHFANVDAADVGALQRLAVEHCGCLNYPGTAHLWMIPR